MKNLKRIGIGVFLLIFLFVGCTSPSKTTSLHDNVSSESTEENEAPEFIQAMYDKMAELSDQYNLHYEIFTELFQRGTSDGHNNEWYFELDYKGETYGGKTCITIRNNRHGGQRKSYDGYFVVNMEEEGMVEYVIDVMTAFAMCNDPQMSYDAARAQVTDMVTTWNGETYSKVIDTGNYKMTMESKQRTGVFFDVLYTDEMWSDPGKKENYLPIDYELVSDYKTNCGMFFEMTGTVEKYQHADYFLDDARVWIKAEDGHTYELKYMYALAPVTFKPGEKYHFYTCLESAQHEDDTKPIILSIRYCEPIK